MEVYRKSELFCSECHTQNTTIQFKTTEKYLLCYPCYSKYGTKHIKARSIQYVCDVCKKSKLVFSLEAYLSATHAMGEDKKFKNYCIEIKNSFVSTTK